MMTETSQLALEIQVLLAIKRHKESYPDAGGIAWKPANPRAQFLGNNPIESRLWHQLLLSLEAEGLLSRSRRAPRPMDTGQKTLTRFSLTEAGEKLLEEFEL